MTMQPEDAVADDDPGEPGAVAQLHEVEHDEQRLDRRRCRQRHRGVEALEVEEGGADRQGREADEDEVDRETGADGED